ncbi:MAG: hypothetical protein H6581_30335 [Bacteroidia bacterium]|nr:hypothetical protein [Bacteroidia bacterium]
MDIQAERYLLIERLKLVNDGDLLQAVKSLLDYGLKTERDRISVEQYNRELEEARKEIQNGQSFSQEDLERESESW